MGNKNQIIAALGPVGQAVQKIIGGNVEENSAAIFDIISTHPHYNAERAASAVRAKLRRENGSRIFSGRSAGKRVARLAHGAAVAGIDNRETEIEEIDFTSNPESIVSARELIDFSKTWKGQDIIARAIIALEHLDQIESIGAAEIGESLGVGKRQAFNIKKKRKLGLQRDLERLESHYLWACENGITRVRVKVSPSDGDRGLQAELEFK